MPANFPDVCFFYILLLVSQDPLSLFKLLQYTSFDDVLSKKNKNKKILLLELFQGAQFHNSYFTEQLFFKVFDG